MHRTARHSARFRFRLRLARTVMLSQTPGRIVSGCGRIGSLIDVFHPLVTMLLSLIISITFLAIHVKWTLPYRPKGKETNRPFERRAASMPTAY